ncbi:MAG: hypothetical protein GEU99_04510 [Luteitalea sp.]|nr:hypothetical protein [Luteitalea sp.]
MRTRRCGTHKRRGHTPGPFNRRRPIYHTRGRAPSTQHPAPRHPAPRHLVIPVTPSCIRIVRMTMLDRMRRHKRWLKWSLALVCVAFVALYFPDFLSTRQDVGAAPNTAVAEVDGRKITVAEFTRAYYQRLDAYRASAGESFDPKLLKQLGIDRQILSLLIDEQAMLAEAGRLGLKVSDAEVRERILRLPGLQENGQFIGEERYRQLLGLQRPPLTPAEFEADVRSQLLAEKLRTALTSWMTVSDEDVEREYRRRNEKAKLEVVSVPAETFKDQAAPSDAELAKYFEKNREKYRMGVKMKIRFLSIDAQALREAITVSPQEARQHYDDNTTQYSTPEQVRASHVLLTIEDKNEAEVRKQAEGLLAKIKGGADIAALATQYSEDPGSKEKGGDLGYFGRGAMAKEFEDAAFSLEPGGLSDVVKSQFGFHIIKVTDKKPAETQPFAKVQEQIVEQLKWQRAQARAEELATEIAAKIKQPSDLDAVARAHKLKVAESNFFERDEPIDGLGPAPEVSQAAFSLEQGQVSDALRTSQGFAFITVVGNQPARMPKLSEVKARVTEDMTDEKALDLARDKAQSLAESLKGNFARAAKAAGLEVETTDFTRGGSVPTVGANAQVDELAFRLPVGGVSDPIVTDTGASIIRVAERTEIKKEDLTAERETLRQELLEQQRGRFVNSYLSKVKERIEIRQNDAVLQQAIPS